MIHRLKRFSKKRNSSIAVGFEWLRNGDIDGFASAGNSGAMMVGSVYAINTIPGVIRPSSAVMIPKINGGNTVLLDVGTNPDAKQMCFINMACWARSMPNTCSIYKTPGLAYSISAQKRRKATCLCNRLFSL